jgi:hypothetical protein
MTFADNFGAFIGVDSIKVESLNDLEGVFLSDQRNHTFAESLRWSIEYDLLILREENSDLRSPMDLRGVRKFLIITRVLRNDKLTNKKAMIHSLSFRTVST